MPLPSASPTIRDGDRPCPCCWGSGEYEVIRRGQVIKIECGDCHEGIVNDADLESALADEPSPSALDMARDLADRPGLDLARIERPWMYLVHEKGWSHDAVDQHIDAALRLRREEMAA